MSPIERFRETTVRKTSAWHRLLAGLCSGLLLSAAALAADAPPTYPNMGAELIEQDALVIDLRTQREIDDSGLIEGARHIEHSDIEGLKAAIGDDTRRTVVLYCGSGRRAARVIDTLQAEGYTGLINAGGYEELYAAVHDTARDAEEAE